MGVTAIRGIDNRSASVVMLLNIERPGSAGDRQAVAPGERRNFAATMWIPWAPTEGDFAQHHLELVVGGTPRYWIWQAKNLDGDFVRFSAANAWRDCGEPVDGMAGVDGDRTLVVFDRGFQLVDIPEQVLDDLLRERDQHRYQLLRWNQRPGMPSVPKSSAVASSVAGPPSDARNCIYRDSGKRYVFEINNGVVLVTQPDGLRRALTEAVSYMDVRVGAPHTAPPFDLIAASGGRVMAKARGDDRFYFLTMDDMFMHDPPSADVPYAVPSVYTKLDPEWNKLGAQAAHLTAHLEGSFANHPQAERWPLFRALVQRQATDMMIVRVKPRRWELIDTRPSTSVSWQFGVCLAVADWMQRVLSVDLPPFTGLLRQLKAELERRVLAARAADDAPPARTPSYARIPTYEHVVYRGASGETFALSSIAYRRVLDIGVGHVHHHQQYETITGGEIQPVLKSELFANGYRFFNGPVYDADGYIDGTCNFYALVELGQPGATDVYGYALLYLDEQTYFSRRWRLVGPDDGGQLLFSLAADLNNPFGNYEFDRNIYWSPFPQHIGRRSRLAVAAQVLLVTGDADNEATRSLIYSTNFSWATMDRTWRWRPLPTTAAVRYFSPAAESAGTEPVEQSSGDTVYPQTIRLREDTTLHAKGTRARPGAQRADVGRWYQRYLPSSNKLVPQEKGLVPHDPPQRPEPGFNHAWKFLPEDLFQLADRFSHFGVYDSVDSRTQYYVVDPAAESDARALGEGQAEPWLDHMYRLYRWSPKFPWSAPLQLFSPWNLVPGVLDRRPPSLFNRQTRLRIVRRGDRWIAMHWDKRDDELLPFGGPFDPLQRQHLPFDPISLELTGAGRRVAVTLRSHAWVTEPPSVQRVALRWEGATGLEASAVLFPPTTTDRPPLENLWRLRIAALTPGAPGQAVQVLDVQTAGRLLPRASDGGYEYRWTPTDLERDALRRYCARDGARQYATSVWFEDIVGHVSVPEEEVQWLPATGDAQRTAVLNAVATLLLRPP